MAMKTGSANSAITRPTTVGVRFFREIVLSIVGSERFKYTGAWQTSRTGSCTRSQAQSLLSIAKFWQATGPGWQTRMAETPRKAVLEPCSRALEWSLATSLSSPSRTSAVGQHGWSNNASAALIPQNAFLSSRRRRSAIGCVIWDNFDKRAQAYIVVSMAPNVLYQIPYATWSVRLVMGVVASLFALAIFGWWLPRAIRLLRNLPAASGGQKIILVMVAVIPVAIGIGPLTVLFALIRNPVAYVTDTGVAQERV